MKFYITITNTNMTTIQETTQTFNNKTQRTAKCTTYILLLGIIIKMSHSVDSINYGLNSSQFESNDINLSENTLMAAKLVKNELNTTSVIVLTSLLDILYGIYPLLSESAKQEIILKFPIIEDSMSSIEKTSSSFLPTSNFTILNHAILTKPFEYNKKYVNILENMYKFTFGNISDSSLKEQVDGLNKGVSQATNGDINNFFTEKMLSDSVFLLLSVVTFDLKWVRMFSSEDTIKEEFTTSEINKEHTSIDFMKCSYNGSEPNDFFGKFKKNGKMFWLYEKKLQSSQDAFMFFIMPVNEGEGKLSDLDDDTMCTPPGENSIEMDNNIMKYIFSTKISSFYCMDNDPILEGDIVKESAYVFIPKFKSSKKNDFKRILEEQGITEIFKDDNNPLEKFSNESCFIGYFNQEVVIEVSEQGVKGSAATTVVFETRGGGKPPTVKFNRPFRYGINVDGKLVLLGSFYGPSKV